MRRMHLNFVNRVGLPHALCGIGATRLTKLRCILRMPFTSCR